ncbi:MAG: Pls/PosA family non-ribosomal peptide synthetase [Bacteroidia bacterium]
MHIPDSFQTNQLYNKKAYHFSAIAVLISKYTNYTSETISFKIYDSNQNQTSISLIVNQHESFFSFYQTILSKFDASIDNNNFTIEWLNDTDEQGCYTIQFLITKDQCNLIFNCKKDAYLETVFKSSAPYINAIIGITTANPNILLEDIQYLPPVCVDEIHELSTGPIDNRIVAREMLMHQLFEETVARYPNNIAISFGLNRITYQELNYKANLLANYFIKQGIKSEDFIAIHLQRSPEMYIAMLGILKAGAAYVPIDAAYPEDRVRFILEDAGINYLISQIELQSSHANYGNNVLYIEQHWKQIVEDKNGCAAIETNISSALPAYIIYTSGSTGRPKGVLISHAAACNLIKVEQKTFGLNSNERIAQGFSTAFDASIEEIWLAFASGSTLFPITETIMHSGAELAEFILQNNISVFSTVPTMLSMMSTSLPSLKLLILGGEYCPTELLAKWHRSDLKIINTYGPTEATVITTYADYIPNKKITIGRPIINYGVYITDCNQRLVPIGVPGELCIAGNGLANGYLNRRELTSEKFITSRFRIPNFTSQRLYRTGDLARYNNNGEIEFLGRIDSQVKLRGYRIELSEIESQLLQIGEIKNAVVVVNEDQFKIQRLIAYILLNDSEKEFNEGACKAILKARLAVYMVPSQFVILDDFPLLPSGKVNRKKLPGPTVSIDKKERTITAASTILQKTVLKIWQKYFPSIEISIDDDFFDLGGHSLLASLVISDLRKGKGFECMSVQDIYTYRTIEKLAESIENKKNSTYDSPLKDTQAKTKPVSRLVYTLTTILQTGSFFLFILVSATGLLSPFVIERMYPNISPFFLITLSSIFVLITIPASIIVSILMKWLLIGKFRAGRYPLWGFYYFRFWLVKRFVDITPLAILTGTPFLILYFKLMGAKVGKNVYLGTDRIRIFDLIDIGDNSAIAKEAHLTGYSIENGELIIGSISIGENCFVGTRAVLAQQTVMEDNSTLGELSFLAKNQTIPKGQNWEGSPAKKVAISKLDKLFSKEKKSSLPFGIYLFFQAIAILALVLFPLVLVIPFGFTIYKIDLNYGFGYALVTTISFTSVYILLFCLFVAVVKWLIVGKVKEEDFSIYSFRYVQKWFVDMTLQFVLLTFKSIYATIYLPSWLRLMGAKVGHGAEISTVNQLSTDLLEIGEGSFLADSVSIGSPVVRNGFMFLRKTSIGSKTFIGNSAVVACGDRVGNNSLIGVLSVPPKAIEDSKMNNCSWLGSPSIFLPKRQESQQFDTKFTFNPTRSLIMQRGAIEFFKITLPMAFTFCLLALFYKIIYDVIKIESFRIVILITPFLLFSLSLLTPFIAVLFKKILIGKYVPSNKPLWSIFVWKNELVNSLCENMVYPMLVNMLMGTPYAPCFFRLMGSKIGKRVYMETTEITEFDLVHIEDHVCLNQLATIQTHLFEDRVMKMSDLYIKKNASVGVMSVILYDSTMEENSAIGALSLVMKGETIPAGTVWAGSPAQFVG